MRILIITPSLLLGGTERFVMNFVTSFREKHMLDIAYFRDNDNRVIDQLQREVNKIYLFPYYVKEPARFLKEMNIFFKNNQYDVVYCHANHTSTILYTFPIWRSKTQIWYHSHNSRGEKKGLLLLFRIIVLKVCNHIFACSIDASKYMYGNKKNVQIIHNCFDADKYRFDKNVRVDMREKYGLNENIVIGNIGRFSKQKNQTFLIEIFSEIKKRNKDARLVLVGNGEAKAEIVELINHFKLDEDVSIFDNSVDIEVYYQMFDVFVLPSLYEGLPFVALEAQASGIPCVLSDNMDKRVSITPLVKFMSVSESRSDWATTILQCCERGKNRVDYSSMIEKSEFGLWNISQSYSSLGL